MAKKKRTKKVSQGLRRAISNGMNLMVRSAYDKAEDKYRAWMKGQNPWLSVPNPFGEQQTNKRMISVRANDYWGSHRRPQRTEQADG